MKSQTTLKIAIVCLLMGFLPKLSHAQNDTSTINICAGQALYLVDTAISSGADSFLWWNAETGTVLGSNDTLNVTGTMTANTTAVLDTLIVSFTASHTGGATCATDTFTKKMILYPHITTNITPSAAFYCLNNGTDVVLTDTTLANGANTAIPLAYTWSPVSTAPAGSGTSNVYTIPASSFTAAGTYNYNISVTYSATLVGSTTGLAGCTATDGVAVIINLPPTVTGTSVQTTFQ